MHYPVIPLGMEKTMVVRLHNLSARRPVMADLKSVTGLMEACDIAEEGLADPTEEDLRKAWESKNFHMQTDAWVIVTQKGQTVGYGEVRQERDGLLASVTRVHPDYRGRGIGTLLTWLVEERAREMMSALPSDIEVTLTNTVSSLNPAAHELLEREGYTLARHFWRLVIDMDELPAQVGDEDAQNSKIKVDLVLDVQNLMGTMQLPRRTGIYVIRQYDVYEKVLQARQEIEVESMLDMQGVTA
jgi:GNAT superfamily N-acetyltransferase